LSERLRREELVSSHGELRLRRRGKWVCRLVDALRIREGKLGTFLAGRWTPDLTGEGDFDVADWFSAFLADGAKVVGGGLCEVGDAEKSAQPFVKLLLGDTVVNVLPRLLARLSLYSVYRKRSPALVAALRTRAVEWCKAEGVTDTYASICLPGTLALAYVRSGEEEAGLKLLRSAAAEGSRGGNTGFVDRLIRLQHPWVPVTPLDTSVYL
jgi:hypothetical protein